MTEPDPLPDGSDRYRIYSVLPGASPLDVKFGTDRIRLAETSLDGIGTALRTLRFPEDGEPPTITNHTRIGILDRVERRWLINPWARGEL